MLKQKSRTGITLVELLVSIGIILVLLAISFPAIAGIRGAARVAQCKNNLRQMSLATIDFVNVRGAFPSNGQFIRFSPEFWLLPYMGHQAIGDKIIADSMGGQTNVSKADTPEIFLCPADTYASQRLDDGSLNGKNYVGNYGNGLVFHGFNGVFGDTNKDVRLKDFADGTSQTAMYSECLVAAIGTRDQRRLVYETSYYVSPPLTEAEFEEFLEWIVEIGADGYGVYRSFDYNRGRVWTEPAAWTYLYNHALGPQGPNVVNGSDVWGIYSAASGHSGVVNQSFVDGHVSTISNQIDLKIWRAIGSRSGNDLVDVDF